MAGGTKQITKREPAEVTLWNSVQELQAAGLLESVEAPEDRLDTWVAEIIEAETDEQALGGTTPVAQLVGQLVRIEGVNFLPSERRPWPYAVVRYVTADKVEGVFTNGGARMVAQLVYGLTRGRVPGWVVKVAEATARKGT